MRPGTGRLPPSSYSRGIPSRLCLYLQPEALCPDHPAHGLTAFLGYVFVVLALLFDLGQPHRIWHTLVMRNPRSVMFEGGLCVMLYSTVEFSPIVFERLNLERPRRIVRAISVSLVIVGVILSTLHQSSLGTLFLIVPEKLHPLWYSPFLHVFSFVSAIAAGLPW